MTYARGGQSVTRGPYVARHSVFSGPRKHSPNLQIWHKLAGIDENFNKQPHS